MARSSIALQLALGLSIGTAIMWLGAVAISSGVLRHELGEAFDETLRQSAFRLLPLATHDRDNEGDGDGDGHDVEGLDEGEEYLSYFVRDRAGRVIIQAVDVPKGIRDKIVPDGFSDSDGRRVFATTDPHSGDQITVIELNNHRTKALGESIAALAWPLVGLIPLIGLIIWLAIRLALRPLERLRRDIASRDGRNLSALSAEGHPRELAPIADAVAALLARLQAAMDAERAFAASSAHELRTPIAGALAQTQQLAHELQGQAGHDRLDDIERALRHLAQLAEKLLQLARLDAGFALADTPIDLLPVLPFVMCDFQSRDSTRVHLHLAPDAGLSAAINMDAFAIALTNLIQNALNHGAPGTAVEVYVEPGNRVRVVNVGPIVAAGTLKAIARPFVRGTTSARGTGLGLSIVTSIMVQTNGVLTLHSPAQGREDGFEAVMSWYTAKGR